MAGIESTSRHVFHASSVQALPVTPACDHGKDSHPRAQRHPRCLIPLFPSFPSVKPVFDSAMPDWVFICFTGRELFRVLGI